MNGQVGQGVASIPGRPLGVEPIRQSTPHRRGFSHIPLGQDLTGMVFFKIPMAALELVYYTDRAGGGPLND